MFKNTSKLKVDYKLLTAIFLMLGFGLLFLYSASVALSFSKYGKNSYYFLHQLIYGAIVGLIAMFITSRIHYKKWQTFAPLLLVFSFILLVAVKIPGIGYSVGGAERWIALGPISIQPAEIAKLALIFYLASWIDKRGEEIEDFYYGLLPALIVTGAIAGLIFIEPDLGTMISVSLIAISMLFVGGARAKHMLYLLGAGVLAMLVMIKLEPYRVARLTTFLNPKVDPTGIGYQINQALLAVGSGGIFGYGYGNSRQKFLFLPEVMGDSVFAVIAEEMGFIRSGLLVGLYLYFVVRGFKIARGTMDTFGRMVAVGIVSWIAFQAFINIGAIIGLLPLTGIPLPFISYGSTALIINLAAMGILLNISKHSTV
jgi:cell division protein FtsW